VLYTLYIYIRDIGGFDRFEEVLFMLEEHQQRHQSWGLTPRFWAGKVVGGREILFSYGILLLCTVSTFESGDFW